MRGSNSEIGKGVTDVDCVVGSSTTITQVALSIYRTVMRKYLCGCAASCDESAAQSQSVGMIWISYL